MRIGIDVTWLKVNKSGGVETLFRNLLEGLVQHEDDNIYYLLLAKDNYDSFLEYKDNKKIVLIKCNTNAEDVKGHLIWQNLCEYSVLKKYKLDNCFFPVYERPLLNNKKINTITTICDILAFHYPEYFSKLECIWFDLGWKSAIKCSDKVIGISEFVKRDLEENLHADNVECIYSSVVIKDEEFIDFKLLEEKYNIEQEKYYYTVCSTYPHKNLITLLNMMEVIGNHPDIPQKLIISGVKGYEQEKLLEELKNKNLSDKVIFTGFVSNQERNTLLKNANVFLFPSIFEGFGIPPIEALHLGKKVITTRCASIEEVTQGKCYYVNDPFNVDEWINMIKTVQDKAEKVIDFKEYSPKAIAEKHLSLFNEVFK